MVSSAALLDGGALQVLSLPQCRPDNSEGRSFPLVLSLTGPLTTEETLAFFSVRTDAVEAALRDHGALYLRGLPLAGAAEFDAFMEALGVPPKPYVGGAAVRHVVHGNVFTSNESPPSETIPFHHEMALVASPPSRIAFFCQLPAASGGETSLLHSQELYRRALLVSPQFMARLAAEGLLYKRTLSREDDPSSAQGRGWLSTYAEGHPDGQRASVEAAMRASGVSGWEWLADGGLRTTTGPLPAFRTDARTGQPAFFNALLAVFTGWTDKRNMGPECVRFGGGGALPAEGVAAVAELAAALAVDIAWEKGDVMLVDNMLAQHSRRPFQGPRRTLAYITE